MDFLKVVIDYVVRSDYTKLIYLHSVNISLSTVQWYMAFKSPDENINVVSFSFLS